MIFYYTATGNCMKIAKMLEGDIVSIPQALKSEKKEYIDETIAIVAPIYAGELPLTVQKFIADTKFKTDYFYMVLTYGREKSVAPEWANNYCQQYSITPAYINTVQMVDNYLPSFDMNEELAIDKKIDEQMKVILADLKEHKHYIQEVTEEGRAKYNTVQARFREHPEANNGEAIIMSDRCVGCGICAQVCPKGNIEIVDKRARRKSSTCDFCLACVQNCPFKAIDLKQEKNPNARYRNADISLKEIILANRQI